MLDPDALLGEAERMVLGLNSLKPRSNLGWQTPAEAWRERQAITVDRKALRDEVAELAAHLERKKEARGLAERLAIERTLINKGLLGLERGGWCHGNATQIATH